MLGFFLITRVPHYLEQHKYSYPGWVSYFGECAIYFKIQYETGRTRTEEHVYLCKKVWVVFPGEKKIMEP